jgi:hypothetical protein
MVARYYAELSLYFKIRYVQIDKVDPYLGERPHVAYERKGGQKKGHPESKEQHN